MATVEQRDTQPSGLATLSNTLDLFNDFKDDKDSDEESFHLPMLDCDDDLDSNSKENVSNGTDKDVPMGETEDEILNKFETTATPDIDPKIEEKLLDEIDELCEKKPEEESVETSSSDIVTSQVLQKEEEDKSIENSDEQSTLESKQTDPDKQEINETGLKLSEVEPSSEPLNNAEAQEDVVVDKQEDGESLKITEDEKITTEEEITVTKQVDSEILQTETKINSPKLLETDEVMDGDTKDETNKHTTEESDEAKDTANISDNNVNEEIRMDVVTPNISEEKPADPVENDETTKDENISVEKDLTEETPQSKVEIEEMEVDESEEINQSEAETIKEVATETANDSTEVTPRELENENESTISKLDTKPESMDVEMPECDKKDDTKNIEISESNAKEDKKDDLFDNNSDNKEVISQEKDELFDNSDNKEVISQENIIDAVAEESSQGKEITKENELKEKESEIVSSITSMDQTELNKIEESSAFDNCIKSKEITDSQLENLASEKSENSNDFNKNLECDDLLDISIIRDVDEDNASAIAENANDIQSSEKSDNDDQEEESEKADNELEESEMEQEEGLTTIDKDDRMDFDDGNSSNLGYQENTVSGDTSDSEAKDYEIRDSENESNISSVLKEKTNRIKDILVSEKNQTDKLSTEMKDADSQSVGTDDQDSLKENSVKLGGKRSLSETEVTDAANKKIKLSDTAVVINEKRKSKKVKTLVSFEKFMQNKKIEKKLTRSDLEQFCLQKICEAIVHKTDVGELHQTIKKQEQIIENLRKDLQQLTKQTRDLDIVNKKLMNELRTQNGIKKPLVPLKITRSVGLQVKLNIGSDANVRRKTPVAVNSRTPNNTNNTPRQRPVVPANTNVVRQIASSPRKTPSSTPLLSQALQTNRQATTPAKRPQIRPKPVEPQKPGNPGVIDLTDEDDKASKKSTGQPMKVVSKTVPIPAAKNVNAIQNKSVPAKTINTNNQNKTVAIGQVKATTVGGKVATPTRTVTALPQGVRLTPTQVKNGSITIPASVVTSSAGTTQLMYVVQPTSSLGQVVTSTAGGTQKAVLLNFQSANGVITSTLNGSAVSVIPTKTTNTVQLKTVAAPRKHPAPLPLPPPVAANASLKPLLPKPHLSIRKTDTGIILQWRMPYNLDIYEGIASYQLFAYQETNAAPNTDMWRKVGDVKALALPMACTLTQFADKNKYYFAVRSVDVHKRIGAFSEPEEISL